MISLPEIRPADPAELGQCRAMLPQAFPLVGRPAELHVAVHDGRIVAAGAMAWVPGGFPLLLHVEPVWRRRGVGRALLDALADAAIGETAYLRPWTQIEEGNVAHAFATQAGFEVRQRLLMFETDAIRFGTAMTALLGRMAARVPTDLVLTPLEDAPVASLVELVADHMRQPPEHVVALIAAAAANGYDRHLSLAVVREDATVGAMLCRREADHLLVDVNVVAPAYRRGPANLLLLEAMARRARAAGIGTFRFSCEDHVRDTIGLARRAGARELPAMLAMARPTPAPAA